MVLWVVFALMTGCAVMAVLWPLSRRTVVAARAVDETAFYAGQLAEIDRDLARGMLRAEDAEGARAEAGRRLIRATADAPQAIGGESEPGLRRRRAASAIALSTVPLVALAVYGAMGSPELPPQQVRESAASANSATDFATAIAQVETRLAQQPDDRRGWEVLAPVYLKVGRPEDAVKAYRAIIRLGGATPERLADYGEALVIASSGVVEADARQAFEQALAGDGAPPKARYYLALAADQDGNSTEAIKRLSDLANTAPADAPWLGAVRARLSQLSGGGGSQPSVPADTARAIAELPEAERAAAINGMVVGLAGRLAARGDDPDGWLRLIRAYSVLGENAQALSALAYARAAMAARPAELRRLDGLATELALDVNSKSKGETP